MKSKKCLRVECGKDFIPSKKKQVYCSTKCRTYAFREKLNSQIAVETEAAEKKMSDAIAEHIKESKKETTITAGILEVAGLKIKKYDYSAMPQGLLHSGREAWKKKAREEQDARK